jgi:hypothetical protein
VNCRLGERRKECGIRRVHDNRLNEGRLGGSCVVISNSSTCSLLVDIGESRSQYFSVIILKQSILLFCFAVLHFLKVLLSDEYRCARSIKLEDKI